MFVKSGGEKTSNLFIVIVETNLGHAPLFSPLLHGSQLIQKKKKSVSSCAQRIDSLDIVSMIETRKVVIVRQVFYLGWRRRRRS